MTAAEELDKAGDDTELLPGMVLTIEPGIEFKPGQMMVHDMKVCGLKVGIMVKVKNHLQMVRNMMVVGITVNHMAKHYFIIPMVEL